MENQSKTASAIMERVKKEEERQMKFGEHESTYHSCIINLVIGTLYCAKENFEVGIDRIIESLKPIEKNLCSDTWFYTKRCFLALAAKLSKLMCVINDNTLRDILNILKNLIMKKNHFSHFETSFFTPSRFLHQSSNNIRKPDHAFHRLFHLA